MKDALGHGSNGKGGGAPLPGHPYHAKTNAELRYISKDAAEAARAMQGHSPASEGKYLDQMNDAQTILRYRERTTPGTHSEGVQTVGRHGYNPVAVNAAIAAQNRSGRGRIGGKEASAIHRLLKGR